MLSFNGNLMKSKAPSKHRTRFPKQLHSFSCTLIKPVHMTQVEKFSQNFILDSPFVWITPHFTTIFEECSLEQRSDSTSNQSNIIMCELFAGSHTSYFQFAPTEQPEHCLKHFVTLINVTCQQDSTGELLTDNGTLIANNAYTSTMLRPPLAHVMT